MTASQQPLVTKNLSGMTHAKSLGRHQAPWGNRCCRDPTPTSQKQPPHSDLIHS